MMYGGARGSGKADPIVQLMRLEERLELWERKRKAYSKARWRKRNTRYFGRVSKRLGVDLKMML